MSLEERAGICAMVEAKEHPGSAYCSHAGNVREYISPEHVLAFPSTYWPGWENLAALLEEPGHFSSSSFPSISSPSQMAQAEMPLDQNVCSDGRPSFLAVAPVAIMIV